MRLGHILYPEAREKLENNGILKRIKEANDDHLFSLRGYIDPSMIRESSAELGEKGYLKALTETERKEYGAKMNAAFKTRDSLTHWQISYPDGLFVEKVDEEDFLLLLGEDARQILSKDELFAYRKFGFDNPTAFVGAVESAISETKNSYMQRGYKINSKRSDGRTLQTVIGGSEHMDLRIFQLDMTPYPTVDPLGNKVPFRPQTRRDENRVAGYHSTEAALLAGILKYVGQVGAKPQFLEDRGEKLLGWARGLGQGGGGCAEHFGGFDSDSRMIMLGHEYPLATVDSNCNINGRCIDYVLTQSEGGYGILVGPNKELMLSYTLENRTKADPKTSVTVTADEIDQFVKGLLYQCASGLGRTSVKQMIDVMQLALSPDFKQKMKRN